MWQNSSRKALFVLKIGVYNSLKMNNRDLFENNLDEVRKNAPLAERMRPSALKEVVGQRHLLGPGKPLRIMLKSGQIQSMILWGPPGSGKTTLAQLVAKTTQGEFIQFSAVTSGVADIRKVVKEATDRLKYHSRKTILFVDEIHRFNKGQQDAFLPHVENGTIILIGATTENPSFEVNAPLISRSQVFVLKPLVKKDILVLIKRSLTYFPKHIFEPEALEYLAVKSGGDARAALNAMELAASLSKKVDLKIMESALQQKAIYYDKKGDWHYDVISALIKSMRGSNPHASLYWLARMIKAGEDPVFIARRMVIFASEDIGNAQPTALVVAASCMQAVHMVGMPEAGLILAQCATYLATAKKSRSVYNGLISALKDIDEKELEPVPLHLRNAPTKLMQDLEFGKGYHWTDDQDFQTSLDFLPKKLKNRKYYFPPEK